MSRLPRWIMLACACVLAGAPAFAHADAPVDYLREIKPLLAQRCSICHGPLKQESGLRLDAAVLIRKGGDSGAAVTPGKPAESLLIHAVTGLNGMTLMPREGAPLTGEEIDLLKRWIDQGAPAPEDEEIAGDPREHWAFQRPVRPPVPDVHRGADGLGSAAGGSASRPSPARRHLVRNPIDAFLAAAHEEHGLVPVGEAPKHLLLRRVHLDLAGLPPKPEQLRAFLADDAPDAFERVVDQLLDSPQYGERWGRHWMDVWRYSDWYGYRQELRNSARHIWRWRDWIVESLNADKSYDRMVLEMLAADELCPTDDDALRATGFLARHYFKFNRNTWLEATVEHTGKAFLGVTLNCARCHDHMYDPISQAEYYRFRAIFEPYQVRTDRVPGEADVMQDGLPRVYDADLDKPTFLFLRGNDSEPDESNPLTAAIPAVFSSPFEISPLELPPEAYYPGLRPHVRQESFAAAAARVNTRRAELARAQETVAAARERLAGTRGAPAAARPVEAPPPPFLLDGFRKPRPELWTTGSGAWHYRDGRLHQEEVVAERRSLVSNSDHPRDFQAVFRFRTTGGAKWKSVGLSFDRSDEANHQGVYLSAYSGGPKAQISSTQAGATAYPSGAARSLPVELGREHELRIAVQDRLVNVFVDGALQIVHRLPQARRDGKLALWTFDATAEFLSLWVEPLPPGAQLAARIDAPAAPAGPLAAATAAAAEAESAATLAERRLAAAEAHRDAIEAKIAADRAKYARPPAANVESLALAAARAERGAAVIEAEAAVTEAEQKLASAEQGLAGKPDDADAKKAVDAARGARDAARKQLESARSTAERTDGDYKPLTEVYPSTSSGRRLALARWIADAQNPLTARVAVNHVWMRHFGEPLVPTVFDFGLGGQPPAHPELLDWLAVEFMENGWSLKHLHRLMVTSAAYRRSSNAEFGNSESENPPQTQGEMPHSAFRTPHSADPDDRSLWRMNSRRLESEAVRDSVLFVGGGLDPTMGGPELDAELGQSTRRRSLYYRHAPEKHMPFLKVFDAASTHECYRRDETVVPQQALALANSPLSVEQSRRLARTLNERLVEQVGHLPDPTTGDGRSQICLTEDAFIDAAFEWILCRPPTDEERDECRRFLESQAARLEETGRLTPVTGGPEVPIPPSDAPRLRARENLVHVLFNHNEFITIR